MKIGHAHLKVRDVERAVPFYQQYLGLDITERVGDQFVFMSGTDMHHEIALQGLGGDAPSPAPYMTGLYHVAFEVGDKAEFARVYQSLRGGGVPVSAVDHAISWAMYFSDPDGNGLEVYVDTRHEAHGSPTWRGVTRQLPAATILRALDGETTQA